MVNPEVKSNVEKLQEWIDSEKKRGLIDIRFNTVFHDNLFADLAVKVGVPEEQVAHFRVPIPDDHEKIIEEMAGEILSMISAPKIEDSRLF
jgi:hypothetical protein